MRRPTAPNHSPNRQLMALFNDLLPYIVLFLGTFLLVVILVPPLSKLAKTIGLVDKPDKRRKLHAREIPLIGGVVILLAVFISVLTLSALNYFGVFSIPVSQDNWLSSNHILRLIGLAIAAFVIVMVGVLDDRFGIRGRQKLMAQVIVALILVGTGTWIKSMKVWDTNFDFSNAFSVSANASIQEANKQLDKIEASQTESIERQELDGLLGKEDKSTKIAKTKQLVTDLKRDVVVSNLIFNRLMAFIVIGFTIVWIVGAINSVNLIDGADGLAGTTTFIISLGLSIVAFYNNHFIEGAIALSLSAAILGFLVFNLPPARIFLGDAGSMLIGMLLASLAVQSYSKESLVLMCLAPFALLFIPIFDSVTAFARRITTGRSIYSTDRGHLHHMLLRHGLSNYGMLFFVSALTLITVVGGILTVTNQTASFAMIGVGVVISFLVSAKVFGFAEFKLMAGRIFRFARSFVLPQKSKSVAQTVSVQLQGSKEWDKLWDAITEFAGRHNFHRIKLDLNLPWQHESFHADWKRPAVGNSEEVWQTRLPLAADGRVYGRIEISGSVTDESVYLVLMLMSDMLETMEPAIAKLAEGTADSIDVPKIRTKRKQSSKPKPSDTDSQAPLQV